MLALSFVPDPHLLSSRVVDLISLNQVFDSVIHEILHSVVHYILIVQYSPDVCLPLYVHKPHKYIQNVIPVKKILLHVPESHIACIMHNSYRCQIAPCISFYFQGQGGSLDPLYANI